MPPSNQDATGGGRPVPPPPWRPARGERLAAIAAGYVADIRARCVGGNPAGVKFVNDALAWIVPGLAAAFDSRDERELSTLANAARSILRNLPESLEWFHDAPDIADVQRHGHEVDGFGNESGGREAGPKVYGRKAGRRRKAVPVGDEEGAAPALFQVHEHEGQVRVEDV